jgi:hypothetical protein
MLHEAEVELQRGMEFQHVADVGGVGEDSRQIIRRNGDAAGRV